MANQRILRIDKVSPIRATIKQGVSYDTVLTPYTNRKSDNRQSVQDIITIRLNSRDDSPTGASRSVWTVVEQGFLADFS